VRKPEMPLRNFTVQSVMLADEANNTGTPVVLWTKVAATFYDAFDLSTTSQKIRQAMH
jgi:hypothetical protein